MAADIYKIISISKFGVDVSRRNGPDKIWSDYRMVELPKQIQFIHVKPEQNDN